MEEVEIISKEQFEALNLIWTMQMLSNDMSGKPFIVWYACDNTHEYYKPYIQYRKLEFERLFNFKMGSPDYDSERIVRYLKYFNH